MSLSAQNHPFLMIGLAIMSTPEHLQAPCARKQLHAPRLNAEKIPEQSTRLLCEEDISVSSRICDDAWQEVCMSGILEVR